jgi:hypothetical protein
MSWLRRRNETLNEKLLREAGYSQEGTAIEAVGTGDQHEPEPELDPNPLPRLPGVGFDALEYRSASRLRRPEPDVLATVECPELSGESYGFTTLPDGSMLVDDSCEEDLSRLADAVEEQVKRPYRAAAVRHENGLWVVSARQITVASVTAAGAELELTSIAGERTYAVDGRGVDETLAPPELAALGEARWKDYAVHAVRLDGDLWEIDAEPL